ncbi:hypothetical protein LCGC14_2288660, partial [marine sediment metagenome]
GLELLMIYNRRLSLKKISKMDGQHDFNS